MHSRRSLGQLNGTGNCRGCRYLSYPSPPSTRFTMPHQPRIAIIYDFDKTLSPRDMQEYGIIPGLGMTSGEFWSQVNALVDSEAMDGILAYTFLMVKKSREQNFPITKETFFKLGQSIEFFKGVWEGAESAESTDGTAGTAANSAGAPAQPRPRNWFERINDFCAEHQLQVEHYIVSSGIKEIILGTPIAQYFKQIYACEFLYDQSGQIQWPKNTLNYTTKTQFMFRINKGVLEINSQSDRLLNAYTPEASRRIPFSNMIYIGDGYTDVPCMKLVKAHGGHSIAVFNQETEPKIFSDPKNHTATNLLQSNRVHTIANADYREGSPLEKVVKVIIEKIRADETLKATVPLLTPNQVV